MRTLNELSPAILLKCGPPHFTRDQRCAVVADKPKTAWPSEVQQPRRRGASATRNLLLYPSRPTLNGSHCVLSQHAGFLVHVYFLSCQVEFIEEVQAGEIPVTDFDYPSSLSTVRNPTTRDDEFPSVALTAWCQCRLYVGLWPVGSSAVFVVVCATSI